MITLEKIYIHQFRGIKELTLELNNKNFAVHGPNGTGKSGVVDAIEFALTGDISRLSGKGMGEITVKSHGPHVDSRNKPADAYVILSIYIPSLDKRAVIKRTVKDDKTPTIKPYDSGIKGVLDNILLHPEFALTRRELIKYVLSTPGDRAKEVESLLRLDKLGALRENFQKIANASSKDIKRLTIEKAAAAKSLKEAMNIAELSKTAILKAANEHRLTLGLPELVELTADTNIKDGLATSKFEKSIIKISKQNAQHDLKLFKESFTFLKSDDASDLFTKLIAELNEIQSDKQFSKDVSKEKLIELALAQFDGEKCPVCDTAWNLDEFKSLLQSKIDKSELAKKKFSSLSESLNNISSHLSTMLLNSISLMNHAKLLEPQVDFSKLTTFCSEIGKNAYILKDINEPNSIIKLLKFLVTDIDDIYTIVGEIEKEFLSLPDPNKQDSARDYLTLSQERLSRYRSVSRSLHDAEHDSAVAKTVFELYCNVATESLMSVYKEVESNFIQFYREIHDDEREFLAQLAPSIGKLGFDVDFYERGFFPPGAYHSEGHQDGMGLCLYLALMRYVFGDNFTFAVLDDVLMSVDSGHRRSVSRLFKQYFPNTQFVITTHDDVWLKSMQTEGLIGANKSSVSFKSWSVEIGPKEWDDKGVWSEIDTELSRSNVHGASALLRYYLEYLSKELCHRLKSPVRFSGDATYSLGDLLPSACKEIKKLYDQGISAAKNWKDDETEKKLAEIKDNFSTLVVQTNLENWHINKSVHYNEWLNFHKNDFVPVVAAFKALTESFRCADCSGNVYVVFDRGQKQSLRCGCSKININLIKKDN